MGFLKIIMITGNKLKVKTGPSPNYNDVLGVYFTEGDTKYIATDYVNGYYFVEKLGGWISEEYLTVIKK